MRIEIRAELARDVLARLDSVPSRIDRAARKAAEKLAEQEAPRIRARAAGASRLARRVAQAVRVRKTGIAVDGNVTLAGKTVPAGDVFYGANWGGGGRPTTRQFDPYRAGDYWFTSQIRDDAERITRTWDQVVDDVAREGF